MIRHIGGVHAYVISGRSGDRGKRPAARAPHRTVPVAERAGRRSAFHQPVLRSHGSATEKNHDTYLAQ